MAWNLRFILYDHLSSFSSLSNPSFVCRSGNSARDSRTTLIYPRVVLELSIRSNSANKASAAPLVLTPASALTTNSFLTKSSRWKC